MNQEELVNTEIKIIDTRMNDVTKGKTWDRVQLSVYEQIRKDFVQLRSQSHFLEGLYNLKVKYRELENFATHNRQTMKMKIFRQGYCACARMITGVNY